jgi:tRNA(His) guanylyltransferase
MANSRFEYVRNFELPDSLLPATYLVVRIDGKGFHRYVRSPLV